MPERDQTLYKVRVIAKHIMIEDFDENGQVVKLQKTDLAGRPFEEVKECLLTAGDELYLPEWKIQKLGTSVRKIMVPVAKTAAKKPTVVEKDEVTVSDLYPEDEEVEEVVDEDDDTDPLDLEESGILRDPIED